MATRLSNAHPGASRRQETASTEHFVNIKQFLYDEGPSTVDEITEHLGLSKDWVATLLTLMKDDGTLAKRRHKDGQKWYWLLAGDA
jgi:predicted transcriptional regulator